MAGPTEPEPEPVFGWRATLFALIFAGLVLGGAGVATAISAPDDHGKTEIEGKADGDHDETEDHDDG